MNFLKNNIWEIERSPLLNQFGKFLAFLHILNYFFWLGHSRYLAAGSKPLLCWGFFENCFKGTIASASPTFFLTSYLILALLAFFSFLWKRSATASWGLLLATVVFYLVFYTFDASLAQDIHGFLIFLNLAFLFVPNKVPLIRTSVVVFYFVLAYRELAPDWLSGAALMENFPFPPKALEWIAAMGVAIKMTLPFLLVSKTGQRLALGAAGLILYHAFMLYFQRSFASLALIVLIFYFIISYFSQRKLEFESLYQSYAHPEPSKLWWPLALLIYLFIQFPVLTDSSPVRLLHIAGPPKMTECQSLLFANFENKLEHVGDLIPDNLSAKVRCHPLVAFNVAKEACRRFSEQPGFESLSAFFLRRRLNDQTYKSVFALNDICKPEVTYSSAGVYE